jgi:hypothetical protein
MLKRGDAPQSCEQYEPLTENSIDTVPAEPASVVTFPPPPPLPPDPRNEMHSWVYLVRHIPSTQLAPLGHCIVPSPHCKQMNG